MIKRRKRMSTSSSGPSFPVPGATPLPVSIPSLSESKTPQVQKASELAQNRLTQEAAQVRAPTGLSGDRVSQATQPLALNPEAPAVDTVKLLSLDPKKFKEEVHLPLSISNVFIPESRMPGFLFTYMAKAIVSPMIAMRSAGMAAIGGMTGMITATGIEAIGHKLDDPSQIACCAAGAVSAVLIDWKHNIDSWGPFWNAEEYVKKNIERAKQDLTKCLNDTDTYVRRQLDNATPENINTLKEQARTMLTNIESLHQKIAPYTILGDLKDCAKDLEETLDEILATELETPTAREEIEDDEDRRREAAFMETISPDTSRPSDPLTTTESVATDASFSDDSLVGDTPTMPIHDDLLPLQGPKLPKAPPTVDAVIAPPPKPVTPAPPPLVPVTSVSKPLPDAGSKTSSPIKLTWRQKIASIGQSIKNAWNSFWNWFFPAKKK